MPQARVHARAHCNNNSDSDSEIDDGDDDFCGPQGFIGVQGLQGSGSQGFVGSQGFLGPQAATTGIPGPQGFIGVQGVPSSVVGPQGLRGPTGATGVVGVAQFLQLTDTNFSVAAGSALLAETTRINTIPAIIIPEAKDDGTVFQLTQIGVYIVDYELSLDLAGAVALYTGSDESNMTIDLGTLAGSGHGSTWIHGKAVLDVSSAPLYVMLSPDTGLVENVVGGANTDNLHIIRITFEKVS